MKRRYAVFAVIFVISLLIMFSVISTFELQEKETQITDLNKKVIDLQAQLENEQEANLVTSLGINARAYPMNYLIVEGLVINVGTKTAYNASLHVIAYNADGLLSLNKSLPLGNMEKWQIRHVVEKLYTYDFLGNQNYTVTPVWTNIPQ
jgi:hypothetical protein